MSVPSVSAQKAFLIGELGGTLVFLYAFGIYTGVYVVTTYIYLKGHASAFQKILVIGTITSLYLVLLVLEIINWFAVSMTFHKRGYSRALVIKDLEAGEYSAEINVVVIILQYASLCLSDVLMLWRCFHACGRSFTRFMVPLGFFVAECTLIVGQISLLLIGFLHPKMYTRRRSHQADIIAAGIFGSVAATSVTSTFMICRTIYTNTTRGGRSRAQYKYIADIIVQSSAIYSTFMLFLFIFQLVDLFDFTLGVHIVEIFIVNSAFGMTGFLPTLMVARLAIGSARESGMECIYGDIPYSDEQSSDNTVTEDTQESRGNTSIPDDSHDPWSK